MKPWDERLQHATESLTYLPRPISVPIAFILIIILALGDGIAGFIAEVKGGTRSSPGEHEGR